MVNQYQLYQSLLTMIEWTLECQEKHEDRKLCVSSKSWINEFAKIKFCLPRGSGHTTFAVKLLTEYFTHAVLILPEISYKHHTFFGKLTPNNRMRVVTPTSLDNLRGLTINAVIIDCSSLISEKNKEKILDFFKKYVIYNPKICFIFLE